MLKKRIIPVQLLIGERLVKTVRFEGDRDVGDPVKSSAVYNSQQADELMFLNIDRANRSVEPLAALIERVSKVCFMPLAVGGGVRQFSDAAFLIQNGADKVVVNSAIYSNPKLLTQIADHFGIQASVASIDARWDAELQRYIPYSDCGRVRHEEHELLELVRECERLGAGEVFVQSIDRDGTMSGYDIRLIQNVMSACRIPIVAGGGSGNYDQMRECFLATGVSALACGSIFNFSDSNPMRAKSYLANHGLAFKRI